MDRFKLSSVNYDRNSPATTKSYLNCAYPVNIQSTQKRRMFALPSHESKRMMTKESFVKMPSVLVEEKKSVEKEISDGNQVSDAEVNHHQLELNASHESLADRRSDKMSRKASEKEQDITSPASKIDFDRATKNKIPGAKRAKLDSKVTKAKANIAEWQAELYSKDNKLTAL